MDTQFVASRKYQTSLEALPPGSHAESPSCVAANVVPLWVVLMVSSEKKLSQLSLGGAHTLWDEATATVASPKATDRAFHA
jgi:hypothetical protein